MAQLFKKILTLIIEYKGKRLTVGDLAKKMYYDGYNFNHFIGMSMPVLLIEVLTRLCFVIKEKFYLKSDVKIKENHKLTVILCIANGILFVENGGKLVIFKNPFAINYVSWINMTRYGVKTFKWLAYDKQIGEIANAQKYIDTNWECLLKLSYDLIGDSDIYCIE